MSIEAKTGTLSGKDAALSMRAKAFAYLPEETRLKALSFVPKPNDIILSTAHKSGTTWMQQIIQSLRSNGDMNFEEICLVIPEIDFCEDYQPGALEKPQTYQPRVFKTHFEHSQTPKGAGKYIVVVREPKATAISAFHHFHHFLYENDGDKPLDDYIEWVYLQINRPGSDNPSRRASQLNHIASWYPHRLEENVLWIHYEDMKENLPEAVRLVSKFLGIGIDDEALHKKVVDQASFETMKKNSTKYDDHVFKRVRNKKLGYPENHGLENNEGKVRSGNTDPKLVLSECLASKIEERFKEMVTPVCGYQTYEEMRAGINKELGRKFSSN